MKLIAPPPRDCSCAVCSRSSATPYATPTKSGSKSSSTSTRSRPSTSKRRSSKGKGTTLPLSSPTSNEPEAVYAASTSKEPYSPPIATLIPPEILTLIFALARPELPAPTFAHQPIAPSWRSFTQLSLVHSSWTGAAQKELWRVIYIRTEAQKRRLGEALNEGWVGGPVTELGFEIKETSAGGTLEVKEDGRHIKLSTILAQCGTRLETLRLRGFGDPAFLLPSFDSTIDLPLLHTLEYSPIDSANPPTTASIFGWLLAPGLPSLKHLLVSPSSRALAPLESVHLPELQEALEAVTRNGVNATVTVQLITTPAAAPTATPPPSNSPPPSSEDGSNEDVSTQVARTEDEEIPRPRLGSSLQGLTLSSILLTSPTLLALLATSFSTLTSLTLSSVHIVGPSSITLLILRALAPSLKHFSWEERLVLLPAGVPAAMRDGLSAEQYWSIIQACAATKHLTIFGERVFEGRAGVGGNGWELPEGLQELSIGAKGEVANEELHWWLERVLTLLRRDEGQEEEEVEIVEEPAELEKNEQEMLEDVEAVEEVKNDDVTEDSDASPEPKPTRSSQKRRRSWTGSFSLIPSSSPPSDLDVDGETAPLPPPTLRSLTIYTVETASHLRLREDEKLRASIQEIVEQGVIVTWFEMSIVVLDTLELTRELRKDMMVVEEERNA